jgi:taurine dioxygenase
MSPTDISTEGYRTLSVTRCSPHIGAEIGGVDLREPLGDEQLTELKRAFAENLVLFFRDQPIDNDDQVRFAAAFGSLGEHVGKNTISLRTENPYVSKFHYDETSTRVSGERFHSDQSCAAVPPLGSMLYLHTIPPHGGGDTMFASMYAAYDALSPDMQTFLSGLTATHDGTAVFGAGTPKAIHPVIARHPVTNKRLIFVNQSFTTQINELSLTESEHMLTMLFEHCRRPDWTFRFRWEPHSIAFWDNRCAHHAAIWDYWPHMRSGYRVQIEGDGPPLPA